METGRFSLTENLSGLLIHLLASSSWLLSCSTLVLLAMFSSIQLHLFGTRSRFRNALFLLLVFHPFLWASLFSAVTSCFFSTVPPPSGSISVSVRSH
ncbi:uncharacterized protein B0T23DRAFT_162606 [Neurospora hispaniola]|uniref:Uncharacterized protein n=1 Tax=Neurospora hispaniola TaxID=588809 RepID=A0AAJ0MQA2_9PEZI|nr:hypothetical protein B0T23DRAFT_162606 [Neurospora hispaniola]